MFEFELIREINVDGKVDDWNKYRFLIFREKSTDVLWIKHENVFKEMLNPVTGLPLTYKEWAEKYKKN